MRIELTEAEEAGATRVSEAKESSGGIFLSVAGRGLAKEAVDERIASAAGAGSGSRASSFGARTRRRAAMVRRPRADGKAVTECAEEAHPGLIEELGRKRGVER
mgnify:CR=1 FL=1